MASLSEQKQHCQIIVAKFSTTNRWNSLLPLAFVPCQTILNKKLACWQVTCYMQLYYCEQILHKKVPYDPNGPFLLCYMSMFYCCVTRKFPVSASPQQWPSSSKGKSFQASNFKLFVAQTIPTAVVDEATVVAARRIESESRDLVLDKWLDFTLVPFVALLLLIVPFRFGRYNGRVVCIPNRVANFFLSCRHVCRLQTNMRNTAKPCEAFRQSVIMKTSWIPSSTSKYSNSQDIT